jgi:ABC-2 type transport system ATP-binding protein
MLYSPISDKSLDKNMAIVIKKLSHHFGDFTAVKELSLALKFGECFGLLGPNGAGL